MAVSIIKRPQLFINENEYAASVRAQAGSNLLLVRLSDGSNHGLTTGNYIYIKSTVENYNGWWYITVTSLTEFTIREYPTGTDKQFISMPSEMVYQNVIDFNTTWACVHLPIVYNLSNNLWPTNSDDTVRTMTVTDSNGYCAIAASGDIKATGSAAALEYVKVTNAGDYNGVYQIISYTNDTTFTIDLAYSSAADTALTAGNIQYYYNNYTVKVRICGGLSDSHYFNSERPYTLLATKDIIPDEDGFCSVEVGEILRKQITVGNNTLLGTLPNNLDAFTMFYIEYAEEYDDSDGTTLTRSTPSYTSDESNFEGFAVNAALPFKNVYSGALSEYVSQDDNQKFLTDFTRPTLFNGEYIDVSFIANFFMGTVDDIENGSFPSALTPWTNTGSGESWIHSAARAQVTVTDPQESKRLEQDYDFKKGYRYLVKWDHVVSSFDANYTVVCYLSDDTYALTQSVGSLVTTSNATTNKSSIITADRSYTKIIFEVNLNVP